MKPARLTAQVGQAGRYVAQSLRLMVGVPDYGAYLRHMQATHPAQPPLSYEAFFRERQQARYGSRTGRCC
ncbi:YbdD/YjiX family protein [Ideonella sp. BN130291]|nr:YbdD/YjiX family protein [Ideonella sp. BN130291]